MTDDQNGNPRRDESAGVPKDDRSQDEDLKSIADDGGKVKDTALTAIPELSGDHHAGLRYLIVHGHNLNYDPAFKNRRDARLAAAVGMLDAGLSPDAVVDVLLDDRFALSRTSKKGEEKRQMLEGEVQRAVSIRRGAEVAKKHAADAEDPNKVLVELNTRHFVSQEGGQWRVYTEEFDPDRKRIVVYRSSAEDFCTEHRNRTVLVDNGEGQTTAKKLGTWWLDHPRRHEYKRIAFLPGAGKPVEGTYNLYRGFAVKPKPGDWSRLREHVFEIVCGGNAQYYEYLIRWMARRVQNLDDQGWAAVVFRGEEGVGKGILAQNFGAIFGQHFLHISHSKHLVGNFNLHLRDCLFLYADEAFWAGDKQGESTLKMLITERDMPIEGKGRDVIFGRNRVALMMASNHDWTIPAGPSARRFFALNVSAAKKGDRAYFNAIVQQMANGGREAMLHDLLNTDLTGFDVRDIPLTAELLAQKIRTYSADECWWLDRLMAGSQLRRGDCWQSEVPASLLHDEYVVAVGKTGSGRKSSQTTLGMSLRDVLPAGWPGDSFPTLDVPDPKAHPNEPPRMIKKQVHCYTMPDLAECRRYFDERAGGQSHGWPD